MLTFGIISEIALIFTSNEDFGDRLMRSLTILGTRLNASRCLAFFDSKERASFGRTYEWCNEGVKPMIADAENLAADEIPVWRSVWGKPSIAAVKDVSALPSDIQNLLNRYRIFSLMSCPIGIGEDAHGSIIVAECNRLREWRIDEMEALETAAVLMDTAYSRKLLEGRLVVSEQRLAAERNRSANIIDSARIGTWEWNLQTGETAFNARWAEIIGYTLDEISPSSIESWIQLTHPEDLTESNRRLQMHLSGASDYYECESRMRRKNGTWAWVLDRGKIIEWDSEGCPAKMVGTHLDITEKRLMEERIRELAIRDPLTDTYNRHYIFERLSSIVTEYIRGARNFSVAILDLDRFKDVNDTYGHQAGDFILKTFAHIISASVRPYDLIGRYGGEEFVIVSMNTKATEAAVMIDRITASVRKKVFSFEGNYIGFTFSGGFVDSSEFTPRNLSVENLISLADRRLHIAKENGRDRCVGPLAPRSAKVFPDTVPESSR